MLTSQTSSSSATSLQSAESKKSSGTFPEKFKKSCVLARKVFLRDTHDDRAFLTVVITSSHELIECRGDEVTNYINLASHFKSKSHASAVNVNFEVLFSDSEVVYSLKIHSFLFAIARSPSQLRLIETLQNVKSVKYKFHELSNEMSAQVTFLDNKQLITNFHDEHYKDLKSSVDSKTFSSIVENIARKTATAESYLEKVSNDIRQLSLAIQESSLPKLLLEDVSCDVFIRYPKC